MTTNRIAQYIASKGVTKHMGRSEAITIWTALRAEGWARTGKSLTKDDHCFTFEPHGSRTAVSYHRMELESAYANYGTKLPHPQP